MLSSNHLLPVPVAALLLCIAVVLVPFASRGQDTAPLEKPLPPTPSLTQAPKPQPSFWETFWAGRTGTETFITEYVGDNGHNDEESAYGEDDNFWIYNNILYLQARNRFLETGIRLDMTFFHGPPALVRPSDDFQAGGDGYTLLRYGNSIRAERVHVIGHIRNVHLTAGDFPVNFGRGIALSLIKQDDTGADNALRGGRFEIRIPRKMKLQLLGGITNSLNVDPLTHAMQQDDPQDRIAAARTEWQVLDAINIAAHGVLMEPRYTRSEDVDSPDNLWVDQGPGIRVATVGGSLEMHAAGFSLYLEGNGQRHDNYRVTSGTPVTGESGGAGFAELTYEFGPHLKAASLVLKAEGLVYRRWLMDGPYRGSHPAVPGPPIQYHHMPTLEPSWMLIRSLGNEQGGRLSADLFFKESDTQITLMTGMLKYLGGLTPAGDWNDFPPTLAIHPLLRFRQAFRSSNVTLTMEGGFRYETTDTPQPGHDDTGYLIHTSADLSLPISGPHSLELKNEIRRHHLGISENINDDGYWVTMTTLGYDMSGYFGIALIHEFSDEIPAEYAQDVKMGGWTLPLPSNHYAWAMVNCHARGPLDGLTIRLLGGSQRGGLKCAGGICRLYPDAVGAKLELVYRF